MYVRIVKYVSILSCRHLVSQKKKKEVVRPVQKVHFFNFQEWTKSGIEIKLD